MYFGEKFASVVWTWGGTALVVFMFSGLVQIWGGESFTISLTTSRAGVALVHTLLAGLGLIFVWLVAHGYTRHSPKVASGERVTPVIHAFEDENTPNRRLQILYAAFLFWVWIGFAGVFAVQIYKERVFDGDGNTPLADGVIESRLAAIKLGARAFYHQEARLGKKGVQYLPVLTDIAAPVFWVAIATLYLSWRRTVRGGLEGQRQAGPPAIP